MYLKYKIQKYKNITFLYTPSSLAILQVGLIPADPNPPTALAAKCAMTNINLLIKV